MDMDTDDKEQADVLAILAVQSRVITIAIGGDNYSYLYTTGTDAFVVDPGEHFSILAALEKYRLTLKIILNTHHHFDHVEGNQELKKVTGASIIAPTSVPDIDRVVADGDSIMFGTSELKVVGTPGHSRFDVSYYLPSQKDHEPGIVWTGDTLFVGGCGRVLGYDATVLWRSLQKLAALPEDTLVYCGHNYTVENYQFALMLDADNTLVKERLAEVRELEKARKPTVPSTIRHEKLTNIFLRAGSREVKCALGMPQASDVAVFAELRRRKDIF